MASTAIQPVDPRANSRRVSAYVGTWSDGWGWLRGEVHNRSLKADGTSDARDESSARRPHVLRGRRATAARKVGARHAGPGPDTGSSRSAATSTPTARSSSPNAPGRRSWPSKASSRTHSTGWPLTRSSRRCSPPSPRSSIRWLTPTAADQDENAAIPQACVLRRSAACDASLRLLPRNFRS
jgi:hypothetical protein